MSLPVLSLLLLLCLSTLHNNHVVHAKKTVRFVSPLHTLTIWDPEIDASTKNATARSRFLPKYEVGLQAEVQARKKLAEKRQQQLQVQATSSGDDTDWSLEAAKFDKNRRQRESRFVEKAYDQAMAKFAQEQALPSKVTQNQNKYQFVGVIDKTSIQKKVTTPEGEEASEEQPVIKWYARNKPKNAKWSVRLVHTDSNAVITDLFRRGKVDVYAQYDNTGKRDEETNVPIITRKYTVKERSWRNLWNFSPKHYFTDSSGMYWRERRIKQGLYTDGNTVYESSYRYRDGRNGMHRVSSLQQYLDSPMTASKQEKEKIIQRLKESSPDIVVEE